MNAIRSVDLYRDTSLDGLVESNYKRGGSQRRNGGTNRHSQSDTSTAPSNPLEVPEALRGPPISYRGRGQQNGLPQRSFSQRAKARPHLKEAFYDGEDFRENDYSQQQNIGPYGREPEMVPRGGHSRGVGASYPEPEYMPQAGQPRRLEEPGQQPQSSTRENQSQGVAAPDTRHRGGQSRRGEALAPDPENMPRSIQSRKLQAPEQEPNYPPPNFQSRENGVHGKLPREDQSTRFDAPEQEPVYLPQKVQSRATGAPLHLNTDLPVGNLVPSNSDSARGKAPKDSVPAVKRSQTSKQQNRRTSDTPHHTDEMSADARSGTLQDEPSMPVEDQRRDWAPHKSPLQKLEVTLDSISKEEKRARVEEAEMLLRESRAGRGGRATSRDITPTTGPKSATTREPSDELVGANAPANGLEEAGLVRNLSSTQRDRLHHSTTVESKKPDMRRLSGDGHRGFQYEEQQYDHAAIAPSPRSAQSASRRTVSDSYTGPSQSPAAQRRLPSLRHQADVASLPEAAKQYDNNQGGPRDRPIPNQGTDKPRQAEPLIPDSTEGDRSSRFPQHNPVWQNNAQSPAHTVPSNITRAISMHQKRPVPHFAEDNDVSRSGFDRKDANSSHKAALADVAVVGATVAAAEPLTSRGGSKRLQKAPPPGFHPARPPPEPRRQLAETTVRGVEPRPQTSVSNDDAAALTPQTVQSYQRVTTRDNDTQRALNLGNQQTVGLGLRNNPTATNIRDKPLPPIFQSQRQPQTRRASVAFKEPLDRQKPVDEWKQAGVARLNLRDFDLQAANVEPNAERSRTWWESEESPAARRRSRRTSGSRNAPTSATEAPIDDRRAEFNPPLFMRCGPLLRYTGMKRTRAEQANGTSSMDLETCRYSVLIVTSDAHSSYEVVPTLRLFSQPRRLLTPPSRHLQGEELPFEHVDPVAGQTKISRIGRLKFVKPVDHLDEQKDLSRIEDDNGLYEDSPSPLDANGSKDATTAASNKRNTSLDGEQVGKYQEVKGARLYADPVRGFTFWRFNVEVELGEIQQHIAYRINRSAATGFWVPARGQSMNVAFHTCNGFSKSVDPNKYSGPDPLWRDLLSTHQTSPFHVMIGGGDQVYMDKVMTETQHFGNWTELRNPLHKQDAPFTSDMKEELETFYLERYCMWFSQGLFGMANSQIPMVNIFDDHDIIDGFGSYPDHFNGCPVFAGLGNVAFKYYLLFQHHSVPEETVADEPSWVIGHKPGPYIKQQSRSVFMHLGRSVAFLGVDARTERTREEVLTLETVDVLLERCRKEIVEGETKHLLVLLGVPIAYPRLVWLENVLTSRAMGPVKALSKAGMMKSGLLNKFDGGVEILDDLDDHWTSRNHKHERNLLIEDLQDLAAEKSVRITILSGDVHLAAVGQFYSQPKLRIPKDKDHRYMLNVISSAIVNKPPSGNVADFLNKRDKQVHNLNKYTDEGMVPMFTHDVNGSRRNNKALLPRRNWCSIREYQPGTTPPSSVPMTPSLSGSENGGRPPLRPQRRFSFSREDVNPRSLIRRISQRGAPPSSYRDNAQYGGAQHSQDGDVDPECPVHGGGNNRHSQLTLPNQRRHSFDSAQSAHRSTSFDNSISRGPTRPSLFKRPTNHSIKAGKKGNVPALDEDGNEFDVNDHVNLEGGLDITLHCELDCRDPAGITAPYRILCSALWYDGSSDREKIDEQAGIQRKPTLLKRLVVGNRPKAKSAQKQGNDNWGKDDANETDSFSGSDAETDHEQRPRGLLGLFGSRRRKNEESGDDHEQRQVQDRPTSQGHYSGDQGSDRLYDSQSHPPQHQELPSTGQSQPYQGTDSPAARQSQLYVIGSQSQRQQTSGAHRVVSAPTSSVQAAREPDDSMFGEQDSSLVHQRLSKQQRILGIGSDRDHYQQPTQAQLRGSGIIGSGVESTRALAQQDSQGRSPTGEDSQVYGPDSFRPPKPERRWSLRAVREKARSGTRWDYAD